MDWRLEIKESLKTKGFTERSFCSRYNLHQPELNAMLNNNRKLSTRYAFALEMEGIGKAESWLKRQVETEVAKYKRELFT
jgi:plasmid maintenance system antidote protein VapI